MKNKIIYPVLPWTPEDDWDDENENTKEQINDRFDEQINKGNKVSIIDKKLFNLTYNFSLDDWRNIHSEDYFKQIENFIYLDNLNNTNYLFWNRRKLLLNTVKQYIKTKNNP